MQLQDPPSNPHLNSNPHDARFPPPPPVASTSPAAAFIGGRRRAHSDACFRLPDDVMDLSPSYPFTDGSSTVSLEEIGSEDDLFSTYIDVEKFGRANGSGSDENGSHQSGDCNENDVGGSNQNEREKTPSGRPRHRHSSSVDGLTSTSMSGEIMEAKKAMPPDKLAELWASDPKRAKRSVLPFSFCHIS